MQVVCKTDADGPSKHMSSAQNKLFTQRPANLHPAGKLERSGLRS